MKIIQLNFEFDAHVAARWRHVKNLHDLPYTNYVKM